MVHPCEAILLMDNELTIERCTGVWKISEGEARPGVFEGAKPLHQAPSGAAAERRGVNVAAVPFERSENKKSPRLSLDNRGLKERRLPTLPTGGSVPSAMVSLTSLFGMGRGGSSPL